ncbi:MNN12 putative alpha-1 [Candida maltosa Xu316]
MTYEQKIVDHVSTLRIFNKCFITSDNKTQISQTNQFIKDQFKLVDGVRRVSKKPSTPAFVSSKEENLVSFHSLESSVLEHRVYPWLSFELPVYERWTGRIQYNPPIMADYIKDGSQKKKSTTDSSSSSSSFFLNKLKQKSNGKGLVLSIGDSHVDDTVRLIHLLRALNNKLPIQIVYYDNLSKDTKNKIVTAATDLMTTVPKSFENVARYFPEDYLTNGLPKQEVWFINTYNAIHADFRQKFKKYSNKFLATLFNSFDEFILIDADTVLMQSPEYFFNLPGYIETGTFFYKDRTTYETRPISDAKFFEKLGPSIIDSVMFNIPIMTQYTLDKPFFKGLFHYMESGLVVLNRNIHYNSILMMLQLNFYTTVNGRIHGDKEIFWLAMAINGDENYTFNEHFAASVGKITPQLERAKPDGTEHKSEEICSPHPGHVSSYDDALVWFNSGFHYCGQLDAVDYAKEFSHKSRLKHIQSLEAFETFYRNPLQIEAAIIPPMDLNIHAVNAEDEPSKGWFMDKRYCNGYCWCGYSIIGGNTKEGKNNELVGKVVHFDDKAIELFKYYGDVWVGIE